MASAATPDETGGLETAPPPTRAEPKASITDWLAVIAGTLGALMATLDISIVNSALPTIQGEIGASGTEGAWVATAYLVAEIIVIPLAAWLTRVFGLRTFLLIAVTTFTGFSIVCGIATSLSTMVIGRIGQGFTGGALIPIAQTIIALRLPRRQQPVGIALFGVVVILGPLLGPLLGGWLTENISWHYAFFINVPVSGVLLILLLTGLPHEKANLGLLGRADWIGILGLAMTLGALTVLLEEGAREEWFASELIQLMALIVVVGACLLFYGQATAREPVIKLKLLLDRQFGAVAIMGITIGMVLYGTSYAIPQFLAAIADYNALQAGKVVLLSGIPSIMLMPFVPLMIRNIDIRVAVGAGMVMMGLSAYFDAELTINSTGGAFTVSQLLRGAGTIMAMMFLSQATVASVPPEDAGDASGLFNAFRNLGGSFALAGISILQQNRLWLHQRRIEESLNANGMEVQSYVAQLSHQFGNAATGMRVLGQQIYGQALVMTYNDIFFALTVAVALATPLVLLLRPLPQDGSQEMAMH
ncbi:DHA2 family efflux MFS transporter permease subunit [Croceicoccus mobilis]|uniref:MFS transporter n=1 Tax=Croceicoccus mobilis TaxID=1703339 RepID=A0A917DZT6_9SPHN|nr:DHA2 family efflux MFS transporter permease subunit [Croceicoccus mobilis]GGD82569.1 MFS transporter [Croceicoccus mobilis]